MKIIINNIKKYMYLWRNSPCSSLNRQNTYHPRHLVTIPCNWRQLSGVQK